MITVTIIPVFVNKTVAGMRIDIALGICIVQGRT